MPEPQRTFVVHQEVARDEPFACTLGRRTSDSGGERAHRLRVEPVAGDRSERESGSLGRVEPVEPGGEQRLEAWRERIR